ncbi:hypothetical protein [Parasitella parasitica]|uniref:Uncharacterized protein n=1 Tax=Parasitella parasitica TaxID=35722 RepID=A0A0B7NE28_9FUNG|nr:hypothetical protein [Parasitella parasitica]
MSDETSFNIAQSSGKAITAKLFKKYLKKDVKECCPYTTWSCNSRPVTYDETYFTIKFDFPNGSKIFPLGAKCTSGGGLAIYGTADDFWAECTLANGTISPVHLFRDILTL